MRLQRKFKPMNNQQMKLHKRFKILKSKSNNMKTNCKIWKIEILLMWTETFINVTDNITIFHKFYIQKFINFYNFCCFLLYFSCLIYWMSLVLMRFNLHFTCSGLHKVIFFMAIEKSVWIVQILYSLLNIIAIIVKITLWSISFLLTIAA